MSNVRYLSPLLFLLLVTTFACNRKANRNKENKESTTTTAITDIYGDWVVRSLALTGMEEKMRPDKYYTLHIDSETLGLPLDVNQCGSGFRAKADSLHIEQFMTCTEVCCDAKEGTAIARFLSGSMHYTIQEKELVFSNKEGTLTLFQPKTSLLNSSWKALSYKVKNSDDAGSTSFKFSHPYILVFQPMTAVLKLDANNCTAAVSYRKNAFEFTRPMGCSRKCCDSKDGILLKDMLQGKNTYTTTGRTMTVTTANHIIEFAIDDSALED